MTQAEKCHLAMLFGEVEHENRKQQNYNWEKEKVLSNMPKSHQTLAFLFITSAP